EHVKDSGLVVVVGVARVALAVSSSLPDQDLVVVASGRQPVSFPTEGQSVDASRMSTQRAEQLSRTEVPQAHFPVVAPRRQESAVGATGKTAQRAHSGR